MMRSTALVVLALLTVVPILVQAQTAESGFVVFIHSGPRPPNDPVVVQIAVSLVNRGFVVRAPDSARSSPDGPRVDYFSESASSAAKLVAGLVNDAKQSASGLSPDEKRALTPRLQYVNNPSTYLGIWLF
jgi:hypothetical protein